MLCFCFSHLCKSCSLMAYFWNICVSICICPSCDPASALKHEAFDCILSFNLWHLVYMDQNTTLLFICLISSRALSDLPGFLNLAFDECLISMKNLGQNSCMSKVYSSVFSALACRCHLAVIFNIQFDLVTVRWTSLLVVEECYFLFLKICFFFWLWYWLLVCIWLLMALLL